MYGRIKIVFNLSSSRAEGQAAYGHSEVPHCICRFLQGAISSCAGSEQETLDESIGGTASHTSLNLTKYEDKAVHLIKDEGRGQQSIETARPQIIVHPGDRSLVFIVPDHREQHSLDDATSN